MIWSFSYPHDVGKNGRSWRKHLASYTQNMVFWNMDALYLSFRVRVCSSEHHSSHSWDYGTHNIGDQRRLRQACASGQSRQSIRHSHTWSMEVDEGSDQNQTSSPTGRLRMRVWRMSLRRTKNTIISGYGSSYIWHYSRYGLNPITLMLPVN